MLFHVTDDLIIGSLEGNDFPQTILDVFNSVNQNIQFTMEVPKVNGGLDFLDINISIKDTKIDFCWFSKSCHSGNSLRHDSWVPSAVKPVSYQPLIL